MRRLGMENAVRPEPVEGRKSQRRDFVLRQAQHERTPLKIAGYAALFAIPDAAKDTIQPGAFARTLAEQRKPIPLYWQHRPEQRIGTVELAQEDERGLRVVANIDNPDSRAVSELLAKRSNGLSFGYRARGFRKTPQGRSLEDIELIEVSLVTHPLQHGARVHLIQ